MEVGDGKVGGLGEVRERAGFDVAPSPSMSMERRRGVMCRVPLATRKIRPSARAGRLWRSI
jgi:hypothetical protein